MEGSDQSSLELGEVEVKISKFALHLSTPSTLIIQNSMKSVRIKAGEEFSLICEAYGRPTPTILWYKNNFQIKRQWFHYSFVNYGIRIINSGTSELKYQFVSTNDSGNYTCHAQNIYGHVQKSIHIEVFYHTSTESITTNHMPSMDVTDGPISVPNNKIMQDKPCFSDLDCLRNSCKENNSISRNLSYKTCVCSGKNDLPKCQTSEVSRKDLFYKDDKLEQTPFQLCKDGCDSNISRLFLLSVLSLLLFLLILFLVMIFITRKQRSRFKRNYSSNKLNCNSDCKNQSRLLIEKNVTQSDSSNIAESYFSWDMVNPVIYLEDSKYFTIHPSAKIDERFYIFDNMKNVHVTNNCTSSEYPFVEKKMLPFPLTKEDNYPAIFQKNADFIQGSPLINKDKNHYMISSTISNNFNVPRQSLKDSSLLIM